MTKILIIEDEPAMRANLADVLELEGFQPVTAANGREGVAVARCERPDLILCDVLMPELDGHGVLAALRNEPQTARIPFVFLTAKGERGDVRAGMDLGADDYLIKPVPLDELLGAIRARLENIRWSSRRNSNPLARWNRWAFPSVKRKCCSGWRRAKPTLKSASSSTSVPPRPRSTWRTFTRSSP